MSCPSQSTQLAEFHNVILTTLLIKFSVSSNSPSSTIHHWHVSYLVLKIVIIKQQTVLCNLITLKTLYNQHGLPGSQAYGLFRWCNPHTCHPEFRQVGWTALTEIDFNVVVWLSVLKFWARNLEAATRNVCHTCTTGSKRGIALCTFIENSKKY